MLQKEIFHDTLLKTIDIDGYTKAHIYASNLSFVFLTEKHDGDNITLPLKIPVASVYVNYYKSKTEGKNLFIIFFYFYPAESNRPAPLTEYLNRPIEGTYGLELFVCDNSHVIGDKNKFMGYPQTLTMMTQLLKTDSIMKLIEDFTLKLKIEEQEPETREDIEKNKKEDYQLYQKYLEKK